ncbi:30S ribosomal protein S12 methylthiotransferase RimO [Syntrophomonas erecta]
MNIGFVSLGCAKNRVDTEVMMGLLKQVGHRIVSSPKRAELIIINTCGFITPAREEAIDTIISMGNLKVSGQLKFLIATGCLSQLFAEELLDEMPELDGVVGISSFLDIVSIIERVSSGERVKAVAPPPEQFVEQGPRILTTPPGLAYVKIAEGCDNRCSYCMIPQIRGSLRSRPMASIMEEAHRLVEEGARELVIVAQDPTVYGRDLHKEVGLTGLIKQLDRLGGDIWIRLMYLHPDHITPEIIETIAIAKKVIPYLDIPIQHASAGVLKRMNRRFDPAMLEELFKHIKEEIPGIVLRTTAMVGFPGEKDRDFEELCSFINRIKFDWLGAFSYQAEEGTPACQLAGQVPEEVKEERRRILLKIQSGITRKKNIDHLNRIEPVLISDKVASNLYIGRTYFQAPEVDGVTMVKTDHQLPRGEFTPVLLKGVRKYDLIGELVDEYPQ